MSNREKRFWSDEEKREICHQASMAGVSVAQVARRYAVNANLIFKWLKDPRFAPDVIDVAAEPVFLPVEISSEMPGAFDPTLATMEPTPAATPSDRIEIELSGGHKISAEARFDPEVLAWVLKGIISRSRYRTTRVFGW
ncbi:IS66-like element accessory protein TnpA [Ruegeria atlantica]|uniref:IS66-like element accessory protein TnpA n=1 Tax=Ruegeria atlantica TaxID=81569 RepID=UPI00147CA773|nr:transposase [Ruegeria atlantica]